MTALGTRRLLGRCFWALRRGRCHIAAQGGDRIEELAATPDKRDPEVLQILGRQGR
jgi:hypothetical protein